MNLPELPAPDDYMPTSGRWTTPIAFDFAQRYAQAFGQACYLAALEDAKRACRQEYRDVDVSGCDDYSAGKRTGIEYAIAAISALGESK